jgi:phosphoribosylpyrophosphate synthetase
MGTKIFSGKSSEYLFNDVIKDFKKISENNISFTKFNNGEMNVKFKETIRGDNVFIIHST